VLTVNIPQTWNHEIEYVLQAVFTDWLDLPYRVEIKGRERIEIEGGGGLLTLDASFFRGAESSWLVSDSMPVIPVKTLMLEDAPPAIVRRLKERVPVQPDSIPVLFGVPRIDVASDGQHKVQCDVDVFGSIFFMLSRYEESVIADRDEHDRFPATASIAYKAGFLHRPIVNEYVELLWAMMTYLWPGLQRKPRVFRMLVSHDVDSPFEYVGLSAKSIIRRMGGDILKRRAPSQAMKRLSGWYAANHGDISGDPHNTFDFIMTESERRGLQSAFYFIPDHSAGAIDGRYTLNDPEIVELMREIDRRGHEIGLHTSYNTYQDAEQTIREADILRQALIEHGIDHVVMGGRQHFLRWATPQTFRNWETAGMSYDTTLGFADHVGFRSGTCWEYPVYDVGERRALQLRERPLVAMEVTVIAERYMNLDTGPEAFDVFADLKNTCRAYRGDFTLLWHNNCLETSAEKDLYTAVLDAQKEKYC